MVGLSQALEDKDKGLPVLRSFSILEGLAVISSGGCQWTDTMSSGGRLEWRAWRTDGAEADGRCNVYSPQGDVRTARRGDGGRACHLVRPP